MKRSHNFGIGSALETYSRRIFTPTPKNMAWEKAWVMASSLVPFCSVFILDETYDSRLSICWAISKLRASD